MDTATIIDWYGPYSLEEAKQAARREYGAGLYMVIGRPPQSRRHHTPQYIGLSKSLGTRIGSSKHHVLPNLDIKEIWLGEVGSYSSSGRRRKKTHPNLSSAEWAHVFLMELEYNKKLKCNAPMPFVLLNRWWGTDYETPVDRPHKIWPDVLEYRGYGREANLVWFAPNAKSLVRDVR
ncbi:hypothetical protein [Thalassospira xiamenensis]|uniref:hypothetical protein n=1 Tax=Thalassospira xiamenensis TaxID=220697 RepID=UPI003AA8728A